MAAGVELRVMGRIVGLALLVTLLFAARSSHARVCTEKQLQTFAARPSDCNQAERSLREFAQCEAPPEQKVTLEIALNLHKQQVCCAQAQQNLDRSLRDVPADCDGRFGRLLTAEAALACLPSEATQSIESLRTSVVTCGCADGRTAAFQVVKADDCPAAQRIERQAGLWMRCGAERPKAKEAWSRATAQTQQLCPPEWQKQKRLQRPLPAPSLRGLFDRALLNLKAINEKINGNEDCRKPDACADDRRIQLQRLGLYLEFFLTTSIVTEEDQAEARALTVKVGLPPSPFDYVGDCSSPEKGKAACSLEEVKGSVALWEVLRSKDLLGRFIKVLENRPDKQQILKNLEELMRLLEAGMPPQVIGEQLRKLPPEARSALFSESLDLGERSVWKKRNEKELSRLDVLVGMPQGDAACSTFVNAVLADLIGDSPIRQPRYTSDQKYPDELRRLVEQRRAACGFTAASSESDAAKGPGVGESLGCGPVLGLAVDAHQAQLIDAHADLHLVAPDSTSVDSSPPRRFRDDPLGQQSGADQVLDDIRMLYNRLRRPPPPAPPRPDSAREHCGIKLIEGGTPVLPPPRGLGLKLELHWGGPGEAKAQFQRGIDTELAAALSLTGPVTTTAGNPLLITVSAKDKERYRVTVELRRASSATRLYSDAMVVDAAKGACDEDAEVKEVPDRWRVAGAKVARHVLGYLSSVPVDVPTTNQRVARLLLPGAEWWSAKEPAKVAGGIAWSAGDIGLFGGGALFVALSIDERNEFARRSGSLDRANTLQYVGFGLLGAFVVERIVWGLIRSENEK